MLAEQILVGTLPSSLDQKRRHPIGADIQAWGEIFRDSFNLEWKHQVLEPLLGCFKKKKHAIQIHRLEKDLVYLSALSISKRHQLFISFPVSPVSLGILLVAYYAHLSRESRDIYSTHHAVSPKDFVIWIRVKDSGQISTLNTTKAFNLVDDQDTHFNLGNRIACLPVSKFDESLKSDQLKVVMVRSLSEATELLKQSSYCSLVVLDDPSGRTYPSPSGYGNEAFGLASLCRQKQIPLVGIVPPWVMKDLEYYETSSSKEILLWPIDFFALCSYPEEPCSFANRGVIHSIEESCLLLKRKRQALTEAQVTIKTFDFDLENEEIIAGLFKEISDLLMDLAKQPHLRSVWGLAWEIWRDLSAPVLPFYLLWGQFLESALKRLELAATKCREDKAFTLHKLLSSLALRLQKLKSNPFIEIIKAAGRETVVAVENAERAYALEQFLTRNHNLASKLQVLPLSQIRGLDGKKLIVLGQPKACYRDLLQTTFFRQIDVLLWSVLAERAERWWSNLEVDTRKLHSKTWLTLTGKEEVGRYGYSPRITSVQVVNTGKAKLSKSINLAKLEESFSTLSGSSLDSGLTSSISRNLDSYYLVKFQGEWRIRVAPGSEFLVLLRKQAQVVAVRELTAETKVVLFEGMNRDELFAQKAGLLEDTRDNYLYSVQLDAWRELVKQQVEKSDLQTVCRLISRDTGFLIGEETIRYNWMSDDDLLSLPREREHFFWFLPPLVHSGFEDFWHKANELRVKRRQLGYVISACVQEGWKERKSDEIIFQYQQVSITVGELRDAMQILTVQSCPQLIHKKPEYPINRLFKLSEGVS